MSLLSKVKESGLKTQDSDVLGGGFTVKTNVYPATIRLAYLDTATSGAISANLDCMLKVDGKDRQYKETIYISNKQGGFTYKDKKSGEDTPLPGYVTIDTLCKAAVGKGLTETDTEVKKIKVYSYETKQDEAVDKEVLMELLGTTVMLGITEETVDKTTKNDQFDASKPVSKDNLRYLPTGETRDQNVISKVFNSDGLTEVEIAAGKSEPKFMTAWVDKFGDKKVNKAKGKATGGATAGKASTQSSSPLFG